MAKYRKKPVVIEAVLWNGKEVSENPPWLKAAFLKSQTETGSIVLESANGRLSIRTLEGIMLVSPGDYVLQGVSGELYPCKPDIFAKTYEKVE